MRSVRKGDRPSQTPQDEWSIAASREESTSCHHRWRFPLATKAKITSRQMWRGEGLTSWQNLRQTGRISLSKVAEYIITCFSWGVALKIAWTSFLIDSSASMRSHSSITKCLTWKWTNASEHRQDRERNTFERSRAPLFERSKILPGVPTTMCGLSFWRVSMLWRMLTPELLEGKSRK